MVTLPGLPRFAMDTDEPAVVHSRAVERVDRYV
jgi:hypothetical protein